MKILERDISSIANRIQLFGYGGPIGRSVQQRAKRLKRVVRALLREFLEVCVLYALAHDRYPVLGLLKDRDVSSVEMDPHMLTLKRVHKLVHLHGSHEVTAEEDILDVQKDVQFLGPRNELSDGVSGAAIADVIAHWLVVISPGDMNRAGHEQNVFDAEVVSGLRDPAGQFETFRTLARVVAGQWIGPEEEGAEPADPDTDLVGQSANRLVILRARFR